jgi:hypothetical protein
VEQLLARGDASASLPTRVLAATIRGHVADLGGRLAGEAHTAAVAERVDRLRARLAEAEAELRDLLAADDPVDPRAVRAWAAETGRACQATGRIPVALEAAYRAARTGAPS